MSEKIREIMNKLEAGVSEMFDSEPYKKYLKTMAKFHRYSVNNSILIGLQKPEATLVAGYWDWQRKFKRHVRKGEKAIRILAPCPFKVEVQKEDGTTEERQAMRFRVASVFDVSQTDGEPLPKLVTECDGTVHGYSDLVEKLKAIAPVPVGFEPIADANGYYHSGQKRIYINEGMPQAQTIKTMVHEIAHSILHDKDSGDQKDVARNTKEVQAESVAYVVNTYLGIDTEDYSFGYIAAWSSGKGIKELKASLEVIRNTAHEIIEKLA